jgi:hypothetical protein
VSGTAAPIDGGAGATSRANAEEIVVGTNNITNTNTVVTESFTLEEQKKISFALFIVSSKRRNY